MIIINFIRIPLEIFLYKEECLLHLGALELDKIKALRPNFYIVDNCLYSKEKYYPKSKNVTVRIKKQNKYQ